MVKNFFIYLFFLNFLLIDIAKSNIQNSIVVKVGKKIVTNYEIKNNILRSLVLTNNEINQNNIDKIKPQILEKLINIKLKEIELEKYKYKVDKRRVDTYIRQLSSNNIEKLKNEFRNFNLNFKLFEKEIETELKWQQLIYNKYVDKIKINESLFENEFSKLMDNNLDQIEFNLSEIEINFDNTIKHELISKIYNEIEKNGFEKTALLFSTSESSSDQGKIGWINSRALSKEIFNILSKMQPGQVSEPIVKAKSILFLKLNKKRKSLNEKIDKEKLKKNLIEKKRNEMFNLYSNSHLSKLKNNYLIEFQ